MAQPQGKIPTSGMGIFHKPSLKPFHLMVYGCQAKGIGETPALPPENVTPNPDGPRSQGQMVWMG